jgi:hypothetical protein
MPGRRAAIEQRLADFRRLSDEAEGIGLEALTREALADRHCLLVARAAEVCAERLVYELEGELKSAFERFLVNPLDTDRQCRAKTAIARALVALDCLNADFFLAGMDYRQPVPLWGGTTDTAADLRATCAMGLVGTSYARALPALVDLLADPEPQARIGAVRAIACTSPQAAEAVLRAKALLGDAEPEVVGECLSALLRLEPDESVDFVVRFVDGANTELVEVAALALGESRLDQALGALRSRWDEAALKGPKERALLRAAALHRSDAAFDWLLAVVAEGDLASARFTAEALAVYRSNERLAKRLAKAVAQRGDADLAALFAGLWGISQ